MGLSTFDGYLARMAAGYRNRLPVWAEWQTTMNGPITATLASGCLPIHTLPSLPSGVTNFIPTEFEIHNNFGITFTLAKLINLGSLDISGPTFTDGNAMPTLTELGVSRQINGALLAVTEVALNASPGSFTVTYVDQDGNTAETITSTAMTLSSPIRSAEFIELNAGDVAVKDVTNATRTGGTTPTGTIRFYGVIPLGTACIPAAVGWAKADLMLDQICPYRLLNGDQLGIILTSRPGSLNSAIVGGISFVGNN